MKHIAGWKWRMPTTSILSALALSALALKMPSEQYIHSIIENWACLMAGCFALVLYSFFLALLRSSNGT